MLFLVYPMFSIFEQAIKFDCLFLVIFKNYLLINFVSKILAISFLYRPASWLRYKQPRLYYSLYFIATLCDNVLCKLTRIISTRKPYGRASEKGGSIMTLGPMDFRGPIKVTLKSEQRSLLCK